MIAFDNSQYLKICFMAGTLEHGGAERQLFYMLQALRERGIAPRVLCLDRNKVWEEPIEALGVSVSWVGQSHSRLARLARVIKELRSDPPDVFQSQHFFANAYVGLSALFLGMCAIGAMRSEGEAEMIANGPVRGWVNLHFPRTIAANSRLAIRQAIARRLPPERLYFLPNVVDTQRFKPNGAGADHPLTLIAVGRLTRVKRFDRFISVLGRLRKELGLDVRGMIVGPARDHGLRKDLEAQGLGLELFPRYLRFLGSISDMAPVYQQADICVLNSDLEGTPNVLLEAMACGLPVVASNVGGVPEVVRHGLTGLVVERDDLDGFVAALRKLLTNDTLRSEMGRNARKHVEENYSLQRLPAYLEGLYDQALPRQAPWKLGEVRRTTV